MAERWRHIPAHPGYEASTLGRIRSVTRVGSGGRAAAGVVLTPTVDQDGYLRVRLNRKLVPVHTLVLLAFHGPAEGRHLNDDRRDNTPENLAWG